MTDPRFVHKQVRTMLLLLLILAGIAVANIAVRQGETLEVSAQSVLDSETELAVQAAMSQLGNPKEALPAEWRASEAVGNGAKVALVFRGVEDDRTTAELLRLLQEHGVDATFYVSGLDAARYPQSLKLIVQEGFAVGSLGYDGEVTLTTANVESLCRANALLNAQGISPTSVLLEAEAPDDEQLRVAYVCAYDEVLTPTAQASTLASAQAADAFLQGVARGGIVCVTVAEETETAARQAEQKRALLTTVGCLAEAIQKSDLKANAAAAIEQNGGRQAEPQMRVYTVQRAAAFTFGGLDNASELGEVLAELKRLDAKALFYATPQDLSLHGDELRLILRDGHDIGLSVGVSNDAQALLTQIDSMRETLAAEFAYPNAFVVRQTSGPPSEALREAASAGGLTLLTAMTNAVREEDAQTADAQAIFERLFPTGSAMLQRGQIVHFRMNVFLSGNQTLVNLVRLIAKQQSLYGLDSAAAMLQNRAYTYAYPLAEDTILPKVKDRIHRGQLEGSTLGEIQRRYVGADWINNTNMLPGFSAQEVRTLDQKGVIPNKDRAVFLTFDDWGTDAAITPILDVLAAHGVKATFFVRTENVVYNPNLLRAIAAEGHEIGCHTHRHVPLATDLAGNGRKFASLSELQADALADDVTLSYQTLQSIVGDLQTDGVPALSTLFRPPTLAVSRIGLETVLDCGFSYSVSGSYSSQDYKAKNAETLARALSSKATVGAVLVLHMSDTSVYTAQALELFLTQKELLTPKRRITFARIGDYLGKEE